jgi:hypothetical protein
MITDTFVEDCRKPQKFVEHTLKGRYCTSCDANRNTFYCEDQLAFDGIYYSAENYCKACLDGFIADGLEVDHG